MGRKKKVVEEAAVEGSEILHKDEIEDRAMWARLAEESDKDPESAEESEEEESEESEED